MRAAASLMSSRISISTIRWLCNLEEPHMPSLVIPSQAVLLCDNDCLFIHFEHIRKVFDDAIFHSAHFDFVSQQFLHRSDRLAFAGNNQIKVIEIGIHVQRESVCRYPARDVYADGGNFS